MKEFVSRYDVLGPANGCRGECEGTGWIPIYNYLGDDRKSGLRIADPPALTDYEADEWSKAHTAAGPHDCDGHHFIPCPLCRAGGEGAGRG